MIPFGFGGYGIYLLFSLPALLLGLWAQFKVKSAFGKYSRVRTATGLTGAEIARRMLDLHGLRSVEVQQVTGFLSDHYDPSRKVLRLSPQVYQSPSLAAAGVAAHEAGHALQDQQGYAFLKLRSSMVPSVQIGSWLGPIIFFVGFFMAGASQAGETIAWIGLGLFAATALFAVVTLPVEFDASRRAKDWLSTSGVIYTQEMEGVNSVLNAAALTYVAGAIQAITTLLYYAFLLLGRSRDD
jgi:Zn-dependent membrane protease YugP